MLAALLASALLVPTPQAVYRALLARPFPRSELPARFAPARVSKLALPQSLHAVGGVRVSLAGGGDVRYVVFPAPAKAVAHWQTWVSERVGGEAYAENGLMPGSLLPTPRMMLLGMPAGRSLQNQVAFVAGTVVVEVAVTERAGMPQHDKVATIALARAANAHLRSVR
ncbi:MAG TPA: hypothetical protein VIU44_01570 [Gaiellaceae bacterium]